MSGEIKCWRCARTVRFVDADAICVKGRVPHLLCERCLNRVRDGRWTRSRKRHPKQQIPTFRKLP